MKCDLISFCSISIGLIPRHEFNSLSLIPINLLLSDGGVISFYSLYLWFDSLQEFHLAILMIKKLLSNHDMIAISLFPYLHLDLFQKFSVIAMIINYCYLMPNDFIFCSPYSGLISLLFHGSIMPSFLLLCHICVSSPVCFGNFHSRSMVMICCSFVITSVPI